MSFFFSFFLQTFDFLQISFLGMVDLLHYKSHVVDRLHCVGEAEDEFVIEQAPFNGQDLLFCRIPRPTAISVRGREESVDMYVVFALHWLGTQPSQRDSHLPTPLKHLRHVIHQSVDIWGHTPWVHAPLKVGRGVISCGWSCEVVDPGFGRHLELGDLIVLQEDLPIDDCQQVQEATPHCLDLGRT